jgi:hypothetical protein
MERDLVAPPLLQSATMLWPDLFVTPRTGAEVQKVAKGYAEFVFCLLSLVSFSQYAKVYSSYRYHW